MKNQKNLKNRKNRKIGNIGKIKKNGKIGKVGKIAVSDEAWSALGRPYRKLLPRFSHGSVRLRQDMRVAAESDEAWSDLGRPCRELLPRFFPRFRTIFLGFSFAFRTIFP